MTSADNDKAKVAIEAWLDQFEGFTVRAERLGEDALMGRPMEPWLREAFKLGLKAGRSESLSSHLGEQRLLYGIGSMDE